MKQFNISQGGSVSPKAGSRRSTIYTVASSLCAPDVKEVNTSKRLEKLRVLMKEYNLSVYIVPSEDQHQSEYVAAGDQRRSFISGFLGSAGVAVITRDASCMNDKPEGLAALSTDGRYFRQATNELDFNWILFKQGSKNEPTWEEWTVNQAIQLSLDSGETIRIGVDPKLITFKQSEKIKRVIEDSLKFKKLANANVELVPVVDNLIDKIWSQFEELPLLPLRVVKSLPLKFTGQSIHDKLDNLAQVLEKHKCSGLVVSALDEIAWLLNLRGSDIDYNPVFYAYAIVTVDKKVILFANSFRFDTDVLHILSENNVIVKDYEEFWVYLRKLAKEFRDEKKKLLVAKNASWEIIRNINCERELLSSSPIEDLKAIKNATELEGARKAHLKDGKALCRFFSWLETELVDNSALIDECDADEKLTEFRKQEENFVNLSFPTISATGPNGAIIHYKPVKGACSVIDPSKLYLNDSGSQFLEGTTDTTRTLHFTTPTAEEISRYTLVLKGNISLAKLKFPENTSGAQIDSVARQHLWLHGLDYAHGTSHGVGAYLNVHEGPIGISPRASTTSFLKPGHLISNEPGYYKDDSYGIRIENVMYVKESDVSSGGKIYYEFETITRVPFCKKLIDVSELSPSEKEWINDYHKTVWQEVSPSFNKLSPEYNWLRRETSPL